MLRLRQMPDEVPPEKRPMVLLAGRGGYHMARPRRTAVGRMALEELVSRTRPSPTRTTRSAPTSRPTIRTRPRTSSRRSCALNPDHPEALIQIAHLETRRGNAAAALPPRRRR
jgi:hypothetical protein